MIIAGRGKLTSQCIIASSLQYGISSIHISYIYSIHSYSFTYYVLYIIKKPGMKDFRVGTPISFRDKKNGPLLFSNELVTAAKLLASPKNQRRFATQLRESVHPKTRIERMHGFGSREPNLPDSFRLLGVHPKKT